MQDFYRIFNRDCEFVSQLPILLLYMLINWINLFSINCSLIASATVSINSTILAAMFWYLFISSVNVLRFCVLLLL